MITEDGKIINEPENRSVNGKEIDKQIVELIKLRKNMRLSNKDKDKEKVKDGRKERSETIREDRKLSENKEMEVDVIGNKREEAAESNKEEISERNINLGTDFFPPLSQRLKRTLPRVISNIRVSSAVVERKQAQENRKDSGDQRKEIRTEERWTEVVKKNKKKNIRKGREASGRKKIEENHGCSKTDNSK